MSSAVCAMESSGAEAKRTYIGLRSPVRSPKRARGPAAGAAPAAHGFRVVPVEAAHHGRRTNDSVYKTVYLDPVTCAVLDTPLLQRLRGLNQLGTAPLVYNNSTHSRFEHSLGVAALAERLCRRLQEVQPQLGCSAVDVLCAKLAGLLHDVGHGPFSHVFEEFISRQLPAHLQKHPHLRDRYGADGPRLPQPQDYAHEDTSLRMVDAVLESLGLRMDLEHLDAPLRQIGDGIDALSLTAGEDGAVLTTRDFVFIKEAIHGGPVPAICRAVGYDGYVGRPAHIRKEWLYDIVSNRHSGLDVDKIDYFARDERGALGVEGGIDERMVTEAYVAWGSCARPADCFQCRRGITAGRHLMICYPEKMTQNAMDFFSKRKTLHEKVYQHKTVCAAQYLVCDIFCHADPFFRVRIAPEDSAGTGRAKADEACDELPISRAMLHPDAFLSLKDSIIDQIYNAPDPNLAPARRLIRRWRARNLYKCVGIKNIDQDVPSDVQLWKNLSEGDIVRQMVSFHGQYANVEPLTEDDLVAQKCSVHCGRKDQNPLLSMRFIEKSKLNMLSNPIEELPEAILPPKSSYTRPEYFIANEIRVFCRDPEKTELANHTFGLWLSHITDEIEQTPLDENELPIMLTQDTDDEWDDDGDDTFRIAKAKLTPLQPVDRAQSTSRNSVTPSQLHWD